MNRSGYERRVVNGPLPQPLSQPVPWYDVKALSNGDAEITIYDVIGGDWFGNGVTGKRFVDDLKKLPAHNTLNIYINSPGGSVYDGRLIYNALKRHKAHRKVTIDGLAASMASVIAMVGDEIVMPENAMMMIHDPLMIVYGNAREMRDAADYLDKSKKSLLSAYREKTGLEDDKISELMAAETWMTAEEAIELGFADKMSGEVKMAAYLGKFDLTMFSKVPEIKPELAMVSPVKPKQSTEEETITMLTVEGVKKDHKDVAEALIKEGYEKGKAEGLSDGAKAELDRIKAVQALVMPGHEELINKLAFDGKTTAEQAAVTLIHAHKELQERALAARKDDAPAPLPPTREPEAASIPAVPAKPPTLEEQAKAEWEKDPQLQAEHDLESYIAWKKVDAAEGFSKHGKK